MKNLHCCFRLHLARCSRVRFLSSEMPESVLTHIDNAKNKLSPDAALGPAELRELAKNLKNHLPEDTLLDHFTNPTEEAHVHHMISVIEQHLSIDKNIKQLNDPETAVTDKEKILGEMSDTSVLQWVSEHPESAFGVFFESQGDNLKVNFHGVNENLLGIGHFYQFVKENSYIIVNDKLGTRATVGSKKPGYFNQADEYMAIFSGDVIQGYKSINDVPEGSRDQARDDLAEFDDWEIDAEDKFQTLKEETYNTEKAYFEALAILGEHGIDLDQEVGVDKDKLKTALQSFDHQQVWALRKALGPDRFKSVLQKSGLYDEKLSMDSINSLVSAELRSTGRIFARASSPDGINNARISNSPDFEAQLISSLLFHESAGGKIFAVSPTGALGLAQMIKMNYHDDFKFNPFNPKASVKNCIKLLRRDSVKFQGTPDAIEKTFVAYNSGPGHVNNAIKKAGGQWRDKLRPEGKAYFGKVRKTLATEFA